MRREGERSSDHRSSNRLDVSSSNRPYSRKLSGTSGTTSKHSSSRTSYSKSDYGTSRTQRYSDTNTAKPYERRRQTSDKQLQESPFLTSSAHGVQKDPAFFRAASYAWENFKVPVLVGGALIALAILLLCVFAINSGKFVKGSYIGDVDVSGMTVPEASSALTSHYEPNLNATQVYVFADEESRDSADLDLKMIEASAQAEQISFEEAKANEKLWIASAEDLGATLPADAMAQNAKQMSDETGFLERIGLIPADIHAPVFLSFNEGFLDSFMGKINDALGKPMDDYSLEVVDGAIYIDSGQKGKLLDKDEFTKSITDLMLVDQSPTVSYVANLSTVGIDITKKKAQKTKKAIETLLPEKIELKHGDASMDVKRSTLLDWISTEKAQTDNGWVLAAHFDSASAAPLVIASLNKKKDGKIDSVTFQKNGDDISVHTASPLDLYDLDSAFKGLDEAVFGQYNSTGKIGKASDVPPIELNVTNSSNEFSLDEALSNGVVTEFSSYTTKYANTASTANRTNNIHLAASKLDKSIAKANGGQWSFNDVAGDSKAEDGYLEANVIEGNSMSTGVGGGICQVATTVFNSVYEAGLPITERHNHTLYTSSYPSGRDAAIAFPYLDLKWKNDTESDILLVTSYNDYSVTVTLVGIDPERSVKTDTGEWEKGSKYKTVYEVDEDLGKDASYVKQNGSDGSNITVTRTILKSDGSVLSTDSFPSSYSATDRVIAYGKKSDMKALKEKYEKKSKKSSDEDKEEDSEE